MEMERASSLFWLRNAEAHLSIGFCREHFKEWCGNSHSLLGECHARGVAVRFWLGRANNCATLPEATSV